MITRLKYWPAYVAFFLVSCQEESVIGEDFFTGTSFATSVIDTITVEASTILYDSFQTSNLGRLLVGNYTDEITGQLTAHTIFQVGLNGTVSYNLEENSTRYDSLVLRFASDGFSYHNPEESKMSVEVRRLLTDIEFEEDGALYNTSFRDRDRFLEWAPIGTRTFRSAQERFDSLSVRLDDAFGEQLYNRAISGDESLTTDEEFLEFLKGFVLSPVGENTPFLGLSPDVELRLYYTDFSITPIVKSSYLPFSLGQRTYYNSITSDREGTAYQDLVTQEEPVSSRRTDDLMVMSGGAGLAVRVEFPYLKDLLLADQNYLIAAAVLEIPIIEDTYGQESYLPEQLESVFVDKDNFDNFNELTSNAILTLDGDFQRDTHYEMNVLNFINTQLALTENNENALVLRLPFPEMNTSVVRTIMGDQSRGMKLTIHTISDNNE